MRKTMTLGFLVCIFLLVAAAGCTTAQKIGEFREHQVFDTVSFHLPPEYTLQNAKGIDSQYAQFSSPRGVVMVEHGLHTPQVSQSDLGAQEIKIPSGEVFDLSSFVEGIEAFPNGIRLVERNASVRDGDYERHTERLSVSVYCKQKDECTRVSSMMLSSLNVRPQH